MNFKIILIITILFFLVLGCINTTSKDEHFYNSYINETLVLNADHTWYAVNPHSSSSGTYRFNEQTNILTLTVMPFGNILLLNKYPDKIVDKHGNEWILQLQE